MTVTSEKSASATCDCEDRDVERLRRMVAAGWDQPEASRLIWSPDAPPPLALAVRAPGAYAGQLVRHVLARRLPWLRLPDPKVVR